MTLIAATGYVPLNQELARAEWANLRMDDDRPIDTLAPGFKWVRVVIRIDQRDAAEQKVREGK